MRIVLLESLAISEETLRSFAGKLEAQGHEFIAYTDRAKNNDEQIKRAKEAEILMIANMPLPGEVIKACPNLKMISVAFTGVDHIDIQACKEKNITVCNAAGYSTNSVAELAFGLMISLMRYVLPCDKATREGKTKGSMIGNELFGKTLGVVGTGAIGTHVVRIALAFGCKVLAFSRTKKEDVIQMGATYVDLETLLKESDIVTLHTPLSDQTRGLLNKEKISLMKSSSVLINTARGPVVDSAALAEALKDGKIAGAAVDVYEIEPPLSTDHPLLNAPNTICTPHIAFATHEAFKIRAGIVFKNITDWLEDKPQNVIA